MSEKKGLPWVVILIIAGVVFVGFSIFIGFILPNMNAMEMKSHRAEIPTILRVIKNAQVDYYQKNGTYVACEPYPFSTSTEPQIWTTSASGNFKKLDIDPGPVRGSYWVEVNGNGFTAYGISDVDGDGTIATYMATKSENPYNPLTPVDVY